MDSDWGGANQKERGLEETKMEEEMRQRAKGRMGMTEKEMMAERCSEWEMLWASYQSTRSIRRPGQRALGERLWTSTGASGPSCTCCSAVIDLPHDSELLLTCGVRR